MSNYTSVNHKIRKHIIDLLIYKKSARFRDLRPPGVDTNLFTYHLKALVNSGMVQKTTHGEYQLGLLGLSYVGALPAEGVTLGTQPNITTMFVVQNSDGDILLQKRTKQPYIDTWSLPYSALPAAALSVHEAARYSAKEGLGIDTEELVHAGDAYIRVRSGNTLLSSTMVHVFRLYRDDIVTHEHLQWERPHKLHQRALAPGVEDIMARTFFKDPFYFEEFVVDWYSDTHELE